ncbi:MAG: hypothetical protein D3923_19620, partial [Candidatus Electrothrix sp. AR3]|nr:hypothetical protein [Candidatus Electrothrix sp. AR3]
AGMAGTTCAGYRRGPGGDPGLYRRSSQLLSRYGATEAYLHTARQRISVRRHARLVDYTMHEGCNARAWVAVETGSNLSLAPKDFFFIAGADKALQTSGNVLNEEDLRQVQASQYEVFEPMGDGDIQLYQSHNRITFYTWGDKECCLSRGTTSATLYGKLVQPEDKPSGGKPSCPGKNDPAQEKPQEQEERQVQQVQQVMEPTEPITAAPKLYLKAGDILIFEEVKGPKTGQQQDADPRHRHAVCLTKVEAVIDRLDNTPVVEISWAAEDALPFPLCISSLGPTPDCRVLENVSIARCNIILADHGRTRKEEDLGAVPLKEEIEQCLYEGRLADKVLIPKTYRPSLESAP